MSAIHEWFGAYNIIFRHIKKRFGDDELNRYLEYLADTAYSDISYEYAQKGLNRIAERYVGNFIKDGGKVKSSYHENTLEFEIICCPAYDYMKNSENPYDAPENYFCDCCIKLNKTILENAGYHLVVPFCNRDGACKWKICEDTEKKIVL